jgi:hypothetical protein
MPIPRTENDHLLLVVDERPTPRPVLARGTLRLNEYFAIHPLPAF